MQEIENNKTTTRRARLTIRISKGSLSFSAVQKDAENQLLYHPYTVRSGISMAANLREAFQEDDILSLDWQRVLVLLDSPVLVIPTEEFQEDSYETYYHHCMSGHENDDIMFNVLPSLNAVAVYAINKDLKMVIHDHFQDVKIEHLCVSVWRHLHRRSFTGTRRKLYGYFHDKQLNICSFAQNRFRFINTYDVSHAHDATYFLLYVWKQLALDQRKDELHIAGDIPEKEELFAELRKYLQNIYAINPSADFNRAPITSIQGLPYDLMTFYLGK